MTTCVTCGQTLPGSKLEAAGRQVAAAAERMWKLDIIDPPVGSTDPRAARSLEEIERIIRLNGWSWALPYKGNGPPQWCGMFAGACWAEAGLDPSWLPDYFASTYRLSMWARYQKFSVKSKPNPGLDLGGRLRVDLTKPYTIEPRPGDIVIVGDGDPKVGDHVTVCMSYSKGTFNTISGNGRGRGPAVDYREGVSRRDYTVATYGGYKPLWLIRPAESDLV